jgi:hypothetical protein
MHRIGLVLDKIGDGLDHTHVQPFAGEPSSGVPSD